MRSLRMAQASVAATTMKSGLEDLGGISKQMNDYVFGFCFNPQIDDDNVLRFLDHCLSHFE